MITTSTTAAVPPVFARAPHLGDPSGALAAWFTEPSGAWVQFVKPARGSDELSEWLTGPVLEAVFGRFPAPFLLVLDFRLMADRDLSARARLLQTAPALRERASQVVLLPAIHATPLHLQTMLAAARLARSFGIPIEIEPSAARVLQQHALRAAP